MKDAETTSPTSLSGPTPIIGTPLLFRVFFFFFFFRFSLVGVVPQAAARPQEDIERSCEPTNLNPSFNYYYFVAAGDGRHRCSPLPSAVHRGGDSRHRFESSRLPPEAREVIDTVAAYSHMFSRGSRLSSGPPAVAPPGFPVSPEATGQPSTNVVLTRVYLFFCFLRRRRTRRPRARGWRFTLRCWRAHLHVERDRVTTSTHHR